MRILRNAVAALVVAAATVTAVVFTSAPASAALPLCTKVVNVNRGGQNISVPATGSNNNTGCLIGRTAAANSTVVEHLQRTMKICHSSLSLAAPYANEKVGNLQTDGFFGPRTEAAVKAVQSSIRVTVDGVYGPQTRDGMRFQSNDIPSPPCYRY